MTSEPTTGPTTSATAIASRRRRQRVAANWALFAANRAGLVGLIGLLCVLALALLAPLLVPFDSFDVTRLTASANQPPSAAHLLGTDPVGRDVLGIAPRLHRRCRGSRRPRHHA